MCGTDYSDCGFRYEHDCPLDGATPTGQVDEAANGNDGATGQVDDTNSDDGAMVVIVAIVASVLVAIVAVAIVGCIVSLKCFAIFVLLLSITTLVTTIVSVFTLFGIPAAAISTVAFVLACTWVQHHRLRLLQGQRRQPGGHISCGVLCLLSFIFRLAALVVLLITFLLVVPFILAIDRSAFFVDFAIIAFVSANNRTDRCYGARRARTRHQVHYMGVCQRGSKSSSRSSRISRVNGGTERHSASAGRASGRHSSELTSSCRPCSRSRPRSLCAQPPVL